MRAISGSTPTPPSWQITHEALTRIAKKKAEADHEEATWLIRALRERVWAHLGYGSFFEYLERLFGYTARTAEDRIRVAHALEELPEVGQALREGVFCWSAVRELTRVAVPSTEKEWIDAARGKSVRQIEALVTGLRPGDTPKDPRSDELRKHVLRFEVPGETLALFRDARARLELEVGHPLPDEEVLQLLARRLLGAGDDEGKAAYQIALTVCEGCGRAWQQGHGEQIPVGPEVVEMAKCDAQHIGNPHVGGKRASRSIPPAVRRQVARRDGGRCIVPGCRSKRGLNQHHLQPQHEGGDHHPENIGTLCWSHHRSVHDGRLFIEGTFATGLTFLHADGTTYGGVVSPAVANAATMLFQALKGMGFTDGEARRGAQVGNTHVGEPIETKVVKALAEIVKEEEARYGLS